MCDVPQGMQTSQFVLLALGFLARPPPAASAACTSIAAASSASPSNSHYPAFIKYEKDTDTWQWLDKGYVSTFCMASFEPAEAARSPQEVVLQSLEQLFWFALTRGQLSDDKTYYCCYKHLC